MLQVALPDLQRGLLGHRRRRARAARPVRRGDPPGAPAGRADAGRARGARPARAAAAPGLAGATRASTATASSCCSRTRTARRWDARAIAEGRRSSSGRSAAGARPVPAAGGDRGAALPAPRGPRHRLAADRAALRRAGAPLALAGGRAQPRRRDRDGRRPGARPGADRRRSTASTATYLYHAARADLLRRLGRRDEAADAYRARSSSRPRRRSPRISAAGSPRPPAPASAHADCSHGDRHATHHGRRRPDDVHRRDALPGRRAAAAVLHGPLRPLEVRGRGRAGRLSDRRPARRHRHRRAHAAPRRAPHRARGRDHDDRRDRDVRVRPERDRARAGALRPRAPRAA